ncbi:MAG: DUF1732 domain-containing protein [Fodinibius sp.]|nr:DUF1732 domain-containing protein [Fodinibius sp.]
MRLSNNDNSVGRRLNFLSQEINREINTIGSKANDSEISQYIVQSQRKFRTNTRTGTER